MKTIKRITAIIMALAMIFALGVDVFAAAASSPDPNYKPAVDGNFDITIEKDSTDKANHTYEAYQIFKGDLATNGLNKVLSNIEWGSGVTKVMESDGKSLLAALNEAFVDADFKPADATAENAGSAKYPVASEVAEYLEKHGENAAKTFADVISKYLSTTNVTTTTAESDGNYKITVNGAGYYFIKDQNGTQTGATNGAYTDFILEVVANTTVQEKAEVPSVDKVILDGEAETPTKQNQVNVGDLIKYELSAPIPSEATLSAYKYYYFMFTDTLSKGLTYKGNEASGNDGKLQVWYEESSGNRKPIEDTNYEVKINDENPGTIVDGTDNKIQIAFKNFLEYVKNPDGTYKTGKIVVTYGAMLNKDAVVGANGNKNDVDLTFSNNPNENAKGKTWPGTDDVVGKTPKEEVYTFTTGLKIIKVGEDGTKRLEGAEFDITATVIKKVIKVVEEYKVDADGEYYKLKDGSYTKEDPASSGAPEKYESTSTKYKLEVTKEVEEIPEVNTYKASSNAQGEIYIEGLSSGTYTITETKAPAGYNKLDHSIEITIADNLAIGTSKKETTCTWTVSGGDGKAEVVDGNIVVLKLQNNKGIQLPETGGIGTTVFYIVGGALLIAALALLVSKMLASSKKSAKSRAVSENI